MPASRREFLQSSLITGAAALAGCAPRKLAPSLSALDKFRDSFDGVAIAKNDTRYETWRRGVVWQMNVPNRKPDIIARPRTVEAAVQALAYARDSQMKVSVKSGGHNVSGAFMRADGMLLDLGEFGRVRPIDGAAKAWVEPAVWSWNLAKAIEPLGFDFPYAHCATVPMGGYLLGGGVGVNGDAWGGLACHSIEGVRVLLASGEIVTADPNTNADLYWAARGAGAGFFGAVIDFKLKLHPAATDIKERILLYPVDAAQEIASWLERLAAVCPKNLELMMMLAHRPPPLAGASRREQKMCLARLAAFGTSSKSAGAILAAMESLTPPAGAILPVMDTESTMSEVMIGSVDPKIGLGFGRYCVDTIWTENLPAAIASLIEPFIDAPSPKSHILATPRHGASLRNDAAFSSLGSSFLGIYTVWDDEAVDDANVASTQELAARMVPAAAGRYINETDGFAFPDKVAACFSPDAFARLADLRAHFDPNQVFQDFPGK